MSNPNPVIPKDQLVFINVIIHPSAVVRVSRYVATRSPFIFRIEAAANWFDLEPDARAAALGQVGALTESVHLHCPPELADLAVFKGQ